MAVLRALDGRELRAADAQFARVAAEGATAHPHALALTTRQHAHLTRDLSDAVHLLCQLFGRYPGLLQLVLDHCPQGPVRDWMTDAADSFERERLYLVRLTASVGPLPSTPGAAQTEATMVAQRHALETLARSERAGCALGAATALVADWTAVRRVLDRAADRVGMEIPVNTLPDTASVASIIDLGAEGAGAERALGFGGEQMLAQLRGLFNLLEARAEARGDA